MKTKLLLARLLLTCLISLLSIAVSTTLQIFSMRWAWNIELKSLGALLFISGITFAWTVLVHGMLTAASKLTDDE